MAVDGRHQRELAALPHTYWNDVATWGVKQPSREVHEPSSGTCGPPSSDKACITPFRMSARVTPWLSLRGGRRGSSGTGVVEQGQWKVMLGGRRQCLAQGVAAG